ncbi:hypothetical protein [uncultured Rhodospira sp.]|uniref:hypothetical protein n=1 Tax=uncultured Rhodospira sp. TaxID=1936189 RepID=UPI00261DC7CC|nr:hypothetical protein [uncultured Rhodospira sp.]
MIFAHGTEHFAGHSFARRFSKCHSFVSGMVARHKICTVLIEKPFHRGEAATRAGWGFAGVAEAAASAAGAARSLLINVQTPKRVLTGRGHASKEEMIATITALGFTPGTDHEADAIGLLLAYMEDPTCAKATSGAIKRSPRKGRAKK